MRRLILNLLAFVVGLIPLYWLIFPAGPAKHEAKLATQPNALLLWGDSRTYNGIDLEHMSEYLRRPVVSYATPGAGVYDFLVFAEYAPQDCQAVVALSFPVFVRDDATDFNRSGMSYWALAMMLRHGVPPSELVEVFLYNRSGGSSPVHTRNQALPNTATPILNSFGYQRLAKETRIADSFHRRVELMRVGMTRLLNKGCSVSMVEIPVTVTLAKLRDGSPYTRYADWVGAYADLVVLYRPLLPVDSDNFFHDLSHLNSRGREWLTRWLADRLLEDHRLP